jgi:hypothetical protein
MAKTWRLIGLVVVLALFLSLGAVAVPAAAQVVGDTIYSHWADVTPAIDGVFGSGEWADATELDFLAADPANELEAYAYFKNDADYLYVAFDVPDDTTEDSADATSMSFDTGHDGVYTDGHDDTFEISGGTTHHIVHPYTTCCNPFDPGLPLHAGLAGDLGFGPSPKSGTDHRIYEYRIPLALLLASPGDTLGLGLDGYVWMGIYDSTTGFGDQWPIFLWAPIDITEYGDLVLATAPAPRSVGGEVYPVNKLGIIAPWIGLAVLLAGGITWFTLRRRKTYS